MGKLLNIMAFLHKSTKRDYIGRMNDNKVECMKTARKYGKDYWDGDRRHGYGGYKYDGRWKAVAEKLIEAYRLPEDAKILDVGCGKGFLLFEFSKLLPKAELAGFDISQYAIENSKEEIRSRLFVYRAQDPLKFDDKSFDLVISINSLHNLKMQDFHDAIREVERIGINKFVVVEAYRNEQELFNLECWALTGQCFFSPDQWTWMYSQFGYTGDYEFIYFE